MTSGPKIPPEVADRVLVANNHSCCICRELRKHVQLHHLDGNPGNNDPRNIVVVCLDCHSRVTGDEGLGRRYSIGEVAGYKAEWEAICSEQEDDADEVDEPLQVIRRSFRVRAGQHACYDFEIEEGWELVVTLSADDYVGISVCGQRDYQHWLDSGELDEYEGEEDVRDCELNFTAPKTGTYLVLVINESDEDVDVTVDAAVWASTDED